MFFVINNEHEKYISSILANTLTKNMLRVVFNSNFLKVYFPKTLNYLFLQKIF